jgi:hypothetical protein
MVRMSFNHAWMLISSLQDMYGLRYCVWTKHKEQPSTIFDAHRQITGLDNRVLRAMVHSNDPFLVAENYLKWLLQFQVNMHQALLSILERHPGGGTPMPAFEIHFQEAFAERHPLATDHLPLFIGIFTTVALTSKRLGVADDLRHAPPSEMSLFDKIFCPSRHALDSLRRRLEVVGNVDLSFASACKTFQWYHSFYGLLFPTITEDDLSRSPSGIRSI